jgi:hypothetical protein
MERNVMGDFQQHDELGQCPRAADALAQRKVIVPPALPKSAGGFSRFGRRVLPVAGTAAAAIGLSGCAAGGPAATAQAPVTPEQRVAQQAQDFTSGLQMPKGKVLKAGAPGTPGSATPWDESNDRSPASPRAVAVETRKGTPRDLVPEGVVVRWSDKTAEKTPAISASEWAKLQELTRPQTTVPTAPAPVAPARSLPPELAADVRKPVAAVAAEFTQVRPQAPVIEAAVMAAEPTFEEALAVLRKHAAERGVHGALAMALLEGSDAKSEALKDLGPTDQSLVTELVAAVDKMAAIAPGASLTEKAGPLVEAARKWQAQADLTLPKIALASRVDSFGVYTPVEPVFEGGRRHSVIIYCEVANFASKLEDGWYTTRLAQQESLMAEDGLLVWRPNAEEVEDKSMNQRKDFYLVKKLTIPDNLAAGHYTLRMAVTDRIGNKLAMVKTRIEIK